MAADRKQESGMGNNAIVVIAVFVLVQFQVSDVCHLHGFSPQDEVYAKEMEGGRKTKRDEESFYASLLSDNKFYGNIIHEFSKTGEILTREIRVKQGRLKGVIREFKNKKLKNVETFLGIPYAAPPVKALRFMPPGSPPTWTGVKIFDDFGPVCPQTLSDLTQEPLKNMNAGHYNHLKGLMPFLVNQSEDCLYLNIYAPVQDYKYAKKFAVIVYIHGESFEWNSGNPYDGSVMSSYGNVVVVTINFRLGILGFLKPGLSEHTVSNFGLLDQIAALQWIKDNIEEFGGDPSKVTLMGHGTGAACINFLMVSPVSMASEGLFHKAILMSGTALSDWAITKNPLQFTIQVAEALNCPLIEKNDELANCLRRKRLSEIMSVKVNSGKFQTPFGPIVDGSVVPNTPEQVMGVYQNLFTRYDLLSGLTEWESYHALDPVSLTYGMLEGERNELLRKYMYSRFEALPYFALATTLSEYLDWRKPAPSIKSAAEEHRDLVLDLLSDARFAAPVIQMALYHSKINPKSYLYIFQQKSKFGEFAESERSVSGEEIAYMFGSPLLNEESSLSYHKFTLNERLLSESILTYFTNFAKTGNPNAPRRLEYITMGPKEWQRFDVYWPEYDSKNQSYLSLGIPPHVGHHYRSQMIQFWNQILPELLNNPTKMKQQKSEMVFEDYSKPFHHQDFPSNSSMHPFYKKVTSERDSWTYGTIRNYPNEYQKDKRLFKSEDESESSFPKQMDHPVEKKTRENLNSEESHSAWVPYLVAVSICLLLINAIVIAIYYFKRKKTREKGYWNKTNAKSESEEGFGERFVERSKNLESFYSGIESSESSPTKSRVKDEKNKPGKLKKVLANTSEGPAKLKKIIQSEYSKYSKRKEKNSECPDSIQIKMKNYPQTKKLSIASEASSADSQPKKSILKNSQRICKSNEDLNTFPRRSVQKVSVGIDATPSNRGASVLKQTPIEITKSLDGGILKMDSDSTNQSAQQPTSVRRSQTSVSLQILPIEQDQVKFVASMEPEIIKLESKAGASETRFRTFLPDNSKDVNVTSRDSEVVLVLDDARIDPLENIQKRNFPKVLPDFPDFKAVKRLSFPQSYLLNIVDSNRNKLHPSFPPPPPPPRVSTLQRKDKQNAENRENASTFSSFSSVNLKTPEKKTTDQLVKINEEKTDREKDENSAPSAMKDKSDSSKKKSMPSKSEKKRQQPAIVIQPKIGPRKSNGDKKPEIKKARVNLQVNESKKTNNSLNSVQLDTKGPTDKVKDSQKEQFKGNN